MIKSKDKIIRRHQPNKGKLPVLPYVILGIIAAAVLIIAVCKAVLILAS